MNGSKRFICKILAFKNRLVWAVKERNLWKASVTEVVYFFWIPRDTYQEKASKLAKLLAEDNYLRPETFLGI